MKNRNLNQVRANGSARAAKPQPENTAPVGLLLLPDLRRCDQIDCTEEHVSSEAGRAVAELLGVVKSDAFDDVADAVNSRYYLIRHNPELRREAEALRQISEGIAVLRATVLVHDIVEGRENGYLPNNASKLAATAAKSEAA